MQETAVCPYFDHDEDICDVGCGYISSHDASMIIKYCSCHYQNCQKYRELKDRMGQCPETKIQPSPPTKGQPVVPGARLPVLGLFCYSIAIASYALDKLPVVSFELHSIAIMILFAAFGQISAGFNAIKKSPLRAIAFTGFGLFWLSILALDILPRAGYGSQPGPLALMGYFGMWGLFCLILCQGLKQLTRPCRTVFVMLTAFLMIKAVGHASGQTGVMHAAALIGLASSLPGFYYGLRYVAREAMHLLHLNEISSEKIRS